MGLFNQKIKSKRIAKAIDITSPAAFRRGIKELRKGGITTQEKIALVLAKNRAGAILKKNNLSMKEIKQFRQIKEIPLPTVTRPIQFKK